MTELALRHRTSGMNSRFAAAGLPFADYVRQTRAMLRAVRTVSPPKSMSCIWRDFRPERH